MKSRPDRLFRHTLIVAVIAAATLAASLGAQAAAEEPQIVTELQSGLNPIGWIEAEAPVGRLFNEIPRLETVYAWDAANQRYVMAARDVPQSLWTLQTLEPGAGLHLQLGGGPAVEWRRPATRLHGHTRLHQGLNLVAYLGPDIENAADPLRHPFRGIGSALQGAWQWDRAKQSFEPIELRSAGAPPTPLKHGDPLWLDLSSGLPWQQPTRAHPPLIWASIPDLSDPAATGNPASNISVRVRRAFAAVVSGHAFDYGITVDPSAYAVHATSDGRTVALTLRSTGDDRALPADSIWSAHTDLTDCFPRPFGATRVYWAGEGEALLANSAYVPMMVDAVAHSNGAALPGWMRDGLIKWLIVQTRGPLSDLCVSSDAVTRYPGLPPRDYDPDAESLGDWEYGWHAAAWLGERGGRTGWIDFIRILSDEERAAERFLRRFNASLADFFAAFAPPSRVVASDRAPMLTEYHIEVVSPAAGARTDFGLIVYWLRPVHGFRPSSNQTLTFAAPAERRFMLVVSINSCRFFVGPNDAVALSSADARIFGGNDASSEHIRIQLPGDACRSAIDIETGTGRAPLFTDGIIFAALSPVAALWHLGSTLWYGETAKVLHVPADGTYAIQIPRLAVESTAGYECGHWLAAGRRLVVSEGDAAPADALRVAVQDGRGTAPLAFVEREWCLYWAW